MMFENRANVERNDLAHNSIEARDAAPREKRCNRQKKPAAGFLKSRSKIWDARKDEGVSRSLLEFRQGEAAATSSTYVQILLQERGKPREEQQWSRDYPTLRVFRRLRGSR
jgi:hypothetical protein